MVALELVALFALSVLWVWWASFISSRTSEKERA